MKTIKFKSSAGNWIKEYLGVKPNTVRKFEGKKSDVREEILLCFVKGEINIVRIEIQNTKTGEEFSRIVTDVTEYDGYYIISWEHKSVIE